MSSFSRTAHANKLIFAGLFLFLLGLIIGLFIQNMANPRMGLAAHLEAVLNGMFLMILGLLWNKLALSAIWLKITFWLTGYGAFANFIAVVIAAVTGYGKMMPLAGGREGTGIGEGVISFLLISLSLCMLVVCTAVLIGFYRYMKQSETDISG